MLDDVGGENSTLAAPVSGAVSEAASVVGSYEYAGNCEADVMERSITNDKELEYVLWK